MKRRSRRRGRRPGHGGPSVDDASLENLFFDNQHSDGGRDRDRGPAIKMLQLCRQVHRRLDIAFGDLADPILCGLWVHAVTPEPGGATLLVEVVSPDSADPIEMLAHLSAARGLLRGEIAGAIHRKRTPHLRFVVVHAETIELPPDGDLEEQDDD